MGWLGLEFLDATTGSKSTTTTIIFRATATVEPQLLTKIDFEDPSLGQLERFSDAMPLRNQYLQSHGVSFRGDTPTSINGLAVLHKSSGFGIGSHGTGDYFFAGIDGGSMLNGGNPFLPEVIDLAMFPLTHVKIGDRIGILYCHCHNGMMMIDHPSIYLEGKTIGFHSIWNVWDVVYCNWLLH